MTPEQLKLADELRKVLDDKGYELRLRELSPLTEAGMRNRIERSEEVAAALRTPDARVKEALMKIEKDLGIYAQGLPEGDDLRAVLELTASDAKKALAAHPAPPDTGWQLIETAPKDGTRILISNAERFPKNTYVARWLKEAWQIGPLGEWSAYPTHWTPLPSFYSHSAPPDAGDRG